MYLTTRQVNALLGDILPGRVFTDDGGFAHVAAWDVRAMLTRVFGFGMWDEVDLHPTVMLYEQETTTKSGKPAYKTAYRATRRLTVRTRDGQTLCSHDGSAVGESTMPDFKRGDGHDMAIKTAESQALKRAAINLGTQFGLSLYASKGSQIHYQDVVRLVLTAGEEVEGEVAQTKNGVAAWDPKPADTQEVTA